MKFKDDGFLPIDTVHEEHWREMPEFSQKKNEPHQLVTVKFRSEEDVRTFSKLTGLTIGGHFQSLWFPQSKRTENGLKVYVDADTPKIKKKGRRTR